MRTRRRVGPRRPGGRHGRAEAARAKSRVTVRPLAVGRSRRGQRGGRVRRSDAPLRSWALHPNRRGHPGKSTGRRRGVERQDKCSNLPEPPFIRRARNSARQARRSKRPTQDPSLRAPNSKAGARISNARASDANVGASISKCRAPRPSFRAPNSKVRAPGAAHRARNAKCQAPCPYPRSRNPISRVERSRRRATSADAAHERARAGVPHSAKGRARQRPGAQGRDAPGTASSHPLRSWFQMREPLHPLPAACCAALRHGPIPRSTKRLKARWKSA
ncbi:hypothetical protein FHW12_001731 [Dokdonella fugitiva]|uniref:Uncharacterized protein n=1 Tax=Dokdonella fugitiva TaxID=328517 RepID=A0A839ESU2_9GAMM|nr:hypothetical protein [Dokdonella fugitiva]